MNPEELRLEQSRRKTHHWKRWGPYLSERAWGTVREDYSAGGAAWDYLPHDHARSRAYRWNEDGIAGICDRHQHMCFALALWNGQDRILKERLFGVSGVEGNHGEDVKECYFYLDSTPTHSYMRMLYKYPQAAFPYEQLVQESLARDKSRPEFELTDTDVFHESRYFDVAVEYAKASPEDILVRISVTNQGPDDAPITLLPTVWFRNTWSWSESVPRPVLGLGKRNGAAQVVELCDPRYGQRWLVCDGQPNCIFTENETNNERLFGAPSSSPYVKDGIGRFIVDGDIGAVNPDHVGTKMSACYWMVVPAGETCVVQLRLTDQEPAAGEASAFGPEFDAIVTARRTEADLFYADVIPEELDSDAANVMRQACAGLLWSKQFYHYVVSDWLQGDPCTPMPPQERQCGRNRDWTHLYNADVISMPDKWEYPWYAAWDLAFHCVPLALLDSDFAKDQLSLMLREWYMHPSGALPAYEWALGDVNPPVHAWAALRVYKIEEKRRGVADRAFLERVFHKLLLNFTWWVNRKDAEGMNVFQGGFLGLDNIGVFDRSAPLPTGGFLEQSDGTSWMGMYTLNLLAIAMELARENPVYEDVASKFWEHFLYIAQAMTQLSPDGVSLWDDTNGFFYDVLHLPDGRREPLRVRSMVGLIPLFAVQTMESAELDALPGFLRRMDWFAANRPDLTANVASMQTSGVAGRKLVSIVNETQLRRMLQLMLDESEFLSPFGIRSLSKYHEAHPFELDVDGTLHSVAYEPAESASGMFGGNSNWRGPIWFPLNYLIIESLQKYHYYYGDSFLVELPTGSGNWMNLWDVAGDLSRRLTRIFQQDADGQRPANGEVAPFHDDPAWQDLVLFHEYFHGDTGEGLGASHQTGWTGLVAKLMQQNGVL